MFVAVRAVARISSRGDEPTEPRMNEDSRRRRLVTMRQALPYIGCGMTIAYELIHQKKITAVKMGGRTLVDLDSVDRFHASLPRVGEQA
jgi:excisionase family DNA binding protein